MDIKMLREEEVEVSAPSLLLLALEGRAFAEYMALRFQPNFVRDLPRGDGHPVLVIPGLGASDASTRVLRGVLKQLGYAAHGWGQGRNMGMRRPIGEALAQRIAALHEEHGQKVSLIGWSLGGVFVRELARQAPQHVRGVTTLGSPFNGHPNANNVYALWKLANRGKAAKLDWEGFQRRRIPPPVPCTAIYSKSDGVVAWQCSLEENVAGCENVEVSGSHFGLGHNPQVIRAIAERLARPL